MHAPGMAGECDHLGLVDGGPVDHAVAQPACHLAGVVRKPPRSISRRPSSAVLQRLRQVPVIERHQWADAVFEERIDQPVVEVEPDPVGGSGSVRYDPRPAHGEAVSVEAEGGDQFDIVPPPVVVVTSDLSALAMLDDTGPPAEEVPDARALAVGVP